MEENKTYGIDAEEELLKLMGVEMNKTKEEKYSEIKKILNIESFMNATNNNLDMLFKYMVSATEGIRLSNIQIGEFIKDEYGDDFFFRRENLRCEEYERKNKHSMEYVVDKSKTARIYNTKEIVFPKESRLNK